MLPLFLLSFAVSFGAAYLTLRFDHLHRHITGDVALSGSHKVHRLAVSRIGGVSVFIGWLAALIVSGFSHRLAPEAIAVWLLCLLPAFAGGLMEDMTKRIKPSARLVACFVSAALAYALLGASVSRVEIAGIDALLAVPALSFVFTCFAVGGLAHAINIIDGLNGLASGVCLIALIAIGYVASQVHDSEILLMSGLAAGAVIGFRVWNYPSGRIFCGDGGAYFLGALVAILSTLLVQRHAQVSAWFPLLVVLYPVWETIFSAYRRRVLRGRPASAADKLHMHTLVYKRMKQSSNGGQARTRRNSDAAILVILFACGSALPAVLWWNEGTYLLLTAMAYVLLYCVVYRRLVRFGAARKTVLGTMGASYVAHRESALHRAAARRAAREGSKLP